MTLKPNKNRVIIKELKPKETSSGGIIIPDSSKERASIGTVVAVGTEVTDFEEGDVVVYSHYSGFEFSIDADKFLSFKAEDLHCVVE